MGWNLIQQFWWPCKKRKKALSLHSLSRVGTGEGTEDSDVIGVTHRLTPRKPLQAGPANPPGEEGGVQVGGNQENLTGRAKHPPKVRPSLELNVLATSGGLYFHPKTQTQPRHFKTLLKTDEEKHVARDPTEAPVSCCRTQRAKGHVLGLPSACCQPTPREPVLTLCYAEPHPVRPAAGPSLVLGAHLFPGRTGAEERTEGGCAAHILPQNDSRPGFSKSRRVQFRSESGDP